MDTELIMRKIISHAWVADIIIKTEEFDVIPPTLELISKKIMEKYMKHHQYIENIDILLSDVLKKIDSIVTILKEIRDTHINDIEKKEKYTQLVNLFEILIDKQPEQWKLYIK